MLLKILFIAALMYFALRAVQNLTRAVRLDRPDAPPRMEPRPQARPRPQDRQPPQSESYRPHTPPRAGRPGGEETRPLREDEDIEDARWEDL